MAVCFDNFCRDMTQEHLKFAFLDWGGYNKGQNLFYLNIIGGESMAKFSLTSSDLIIEYMILKVKNGYEPCVSIEELTSFLSFYKHYQSFNVKKELTDILDDFFAMQTKRWGKNLRIVQTHTGALKPTYRLTDTSSTVACQLTKSSLSEIQSPIYHYLNVLSKRRIDVCISISRENLKTGKYVAAVIVRLVLDELREMYFQMAPDNLKYMKIERVIFSDEFDSDEVLKMRKQILQFYDLISKRVAVLLEQDLSLKIARQTDKCLAKANFNLIVSGYEDFVDQYVKSNVYIDVCSGTYKVYCTSPLASLFVDPYFQTIQKERALKSHSTGELVAILDNSM